MKEQVNDIYDQIAGEESTSLGDLLSKIPGLSGYMERGRRRDAEHGEADRRQLGVAGATAADFAQGRLARLDHARHGDVAGGVEQFGYRQNDGDVLLE